jgi:hypothetical protein
MNCAHTKIYKRRKERLDLNCNYMNLAYHPLVISSHIYHAHSYDVPSSQKKIICVLLNFLASKEIMPYDRAP